MTSLDLPLASAGVNSTITTDWAAVLTYVNGLLADPTIASKYWKVGEAAAELDSLLAQAARQGS